MRRTHRRVLVEVVEKEYGGGNGGGEESMVGPA